MTRRRRALNSGANGDVPSHPRSSSLRTTRAAGCGATRSPRTKEPGPICQLSPQAQDLLLNPGLPRLECCRPCLGFGAAAIERSSCGAGAWPTAAAYSISKVRELHRTAMAMLRLRLGATQKLLAIQGIHGVTDAVSIQVNNIAHLCQASPAFQFQLARLAHVNVSPPYRNSRPTEGTPGRRHAWPFVLGKSLESSHAFHHGFRSLHPPD